MSCLPPDPASFHTSECLASRSIARTTSGSLRANKTFIVGRLSDGHSCPTIKQSPTDTYPSGAVGRQHDPSSFAPVPVSVYNNAHSTSLACKARNVLENVAMTTMARVDGDGIVRMHYM